MSRAPAHRGFTLIELIIAIVVIGVCAVSLLGLLSTMAARSGEALVQPQASSIAAVYLEEILAQPVQDSAGGDGEAQRQDFDDTDDYDLLVDAGARDQSNAQIAGLEQYIVRVNVSATTLNAVNALRIDVAVTDPRGGVTLLTGYRTSYNWQVLR